MSLSSIHLDAFFEVCRTRNFSEAAKNLSITQSALSQRIMNLESDLGVTLLLREKGNITMTEFGEKLLGYCEMRVGVENELLTHIKGHSSEFIGELRIAGYSTIMRSGVIPSLRKLLKGNPGIQLEIATRELKDLPETLRSGEAQFVFLNRIPEKSGIVSKLLAHEEYVLISSVKEKTPENVYIDHDKDDTTTFDFLNSQKEKMPKLQRMFFDETYSLIEAVEMGFGRAVVPKHLILNNKKVKVLPNYKSMKVPVYLCYKEQSFYTELQKSFLRVVSEDFKLD